MAVSPKYSKKTAKKAIAQYAHQTPTNRASLAGTCQGLPRGKTAIAPEAIAAQPSHPKARGA
ncbi:MAG: hypothetical protein HC824_15405 [Synechococcales cyanobacterium RM1_1_8]|nr:hypothetical protein [Synechococcales cyanobacterium RM1_1_8]